MPKRHGRRYRARAVLSLVAALTLAGCAGLPGGAAYEEGSTTDDPTAQETPVTEAPDDGEAQDGAESSEVAETEPEEADAAETEPAESEPPATQTEAPDARDPRTPVTVVAAATMGTAAVVSAGGYVQDVIELGGTCHYTLSQGIEVVTGDSAAEPDATTTWCANVELRLPHPGEPWTLDVRYESPMSVGHGELTSAGDVS